MISTEPSCRLVLEDGSVFPGRSFGLQGSVSGEVVFNTGMVGYPEALTDPSYRGQVLVLTYPLVGNYGVPPSNNGHNDDLSSVFESGRIQISGLVVSEVSQEYSHWSANRGLGCWLEEHGVPGVAGIDTRALTRRLREKGTMLGKILQDGEDLEFYDPGTDNLVSQVSVSQPAIYAGSRKRVLLVDCGCKLSIVRGLLSRGVTVIRVPWAYDFFSEQFDGVVISNGPGDPKMCLPTIANVRRAVENDIPVFGICLGHQILALASGADTYKLKFGHRSQNQPCNEAGTKRCLITSQNHGYAVRNESLRDGWEPWFINVNDRTNEGLRHRSKPFMSVQFHPEAAPGPVDAGILFDEFLKHL
ncbi:MAG: glutamine-hydrolyzing carbamoyl-phosphate synthase small subunit [Acidobacteria bacterium]|nr:glutamine-hydrolyzing carbamoyl-phosphate synthase small subunit [Acidobacteriota bacterium]MCI0620411.1 glutamine-hydrolyzing carbamoyl-phosphate synthase small subunit [Acidobacteriota bacterium]MCI0718274.1 glutamine-hydrolyzing carbamoyl-phosphate synthase small subunit [Acidobacteriota bacterium]